MSETFNKRDRSQDDEDNLAAAPEAKRVAKSPWKTASKGNKEVPAEPPRPYPYFFYIDHFREADPDPFMPVTQPGRTPCFLMKMHALLSNTKLADIIAWDDHGRSFRILRRKEFETKVMPKYFEHTKFGEFDLLSFGFTHLGLYLNFHAVCNCLLSCRLLHEAGQWMGLQVIQSRKQTLTTFI